MTRTLRMRPSRKPCSCRRGTDEKLKAFNARIATGFIVTDRMEVAPPLITLEKVDEKKRGKLPVLLATFCPFCGKRFEATP